MSFGLRGAVAVAAACATLGSATAQTSSATLSADQVRALGIACEVDIAKLCGGLPPGDERLLACLKENRGAVVPPCQAAIAALVASQRKR